MRLTRVERKPSTESPWRSLLQGISFCDERLADTVGAVATELAEVYWACSIPCFCRSLRIRFCMAGRVGWVCLMSSAGVGAVLGALHFAARTEFTGLARWIAGTATTCGIGFDQFFHNRASSGYRWWCFLWWGFPPRADGGDEYDYSEPCAGRIARADHGRVREDCSWACSRLGRCWAGRSGEADWGALYAGSFGFAGAGGELGVSIFGW